GPGHRAPVHQLQIHLIRTAMRRACFLFFVALLVAGLAIAPAWAGGSGHSHDEPSTSPVAIMLLGAVTALGLAAAHRWRRRAALVVAVLGVESGVHSAHHFADPQAAASCALFAASQHDESAGAVATVSTTPIWTTELSPLHEIVLVRPLHAFRSYEGRAPPR